jgi:hypothetical protein
MIVSFLGGIVQIHALLSIPQNPSNDGGEARSGEPPTKSADQRRNPSRTASEGTGIA